MIDARERSDRHTPSPIRTAPTLPRLLLQNSTKTPLSQPIHFLSSCYHLRSAPRSTCLRSSHHLPHLPIREARASPPTTPIPTAYPSSEPPTSFTPRQHISSIRTLLSRYSPFKPSRLFQRLSLFPHATEPYSNTSPFAWATPGPHRPRPGACPNSFPAPSPNSLLSRL